MGDDKLSLASTKVLSDGHQIPIFGLGLSHNGGWSDAAVKEALSLGIRLFDTAKRYGNEAQLGQILTKSGIPREELFLTSKLWPGDIRNVRKECIASCERLGVSYLDLYLVHWPGVDHAHTVEQCTQQRLNTWRQMEALVDEGLVRSIGVSNFQLEHLEPLLPHCKHLPQVNQIEFNPFQNPKELKTFCENSGIALEGYCPLGKGELVTRSVITEIAAAHRCTAAQVLLRWSLQKGVITIPKSTQPAHLRENAQCFAVELTDEDMARLDGLHCNLRCTWDPTGVP